MKKTKSALLQSIIALVLCLSMLVGTTFAWFTDEVKSGVNQILAGNLDVRLEYQDAEGNWHDVNGATEIFDPNALWEPGYTQVVYLRVTNAGSLALKYQLGVNVVSETGTLNAAGEPFLLSRHIRFGVVEDVTTPYADRDAARAAVTGSAVISEGYSKADSMSPAQEKYLAMVVYMPESVGNEANYLTGENPPKIELGINLIATQMTADSESDSFGPDYDAGAAFPQQNIQYSVGMSVSNKVENNVLTEAVTIGQANEISAVIPDGVQMAEDATSLQLSVNTIPEEDSQANVTLNDGEVSTSVDIHVDGVSEDNETPMLITLPGFVPAGLYNSNIALYHVENGETKPMTKVATLGELDAHNEFYYDDQTGDVVVALASFSEVFVAFDKYNEWNGTDVDTTWYDPDNTAHILYDAADLAGFAQIVGGMADGIERDSFAGETIELKASIDLCDKLWYPVGYYFTDDKNGDSTTGDYYSDLYPFEGTFDGGGYTIANFRQNTWEMEGTDPHYDVSVNRYYNDGMGLFGFIIDGTVKNLAICGMVADGEFTDIGAVTAYARGTCIFESIRISDVSCYSYNCRTAGIVGYDWIGDSPSAYTFTDIEIDPTCTFGALWGSWDVACAGIMGYMNDTSSATFTNCNVGCVLDVYNDVCANYQYYQYRYSGMMIGTVGKDGDPTDMTGKLSFTNCTVCYGDWANYYYCEFVKNSLASYTHDYQFSRVPKDEITFDANGEITGCTHDHAAQGTETVDGNKVLIEDKTAIMIPFRQIYTGYGWGAQAVVEGVEIKEARYTIAYVNNGKVLDVTYIFNNTVPQSVGNDDMVTLANESMDAMGYENLEFSHWMNAGSTKVTEVPAGNTTNIVLYPSYKELYTAMFLDQSGNILDWTMFTTGDKDELVDMGQSLLENGKVPLSDGFEFDYWAVHVTDDDGNTTTDKDLNEYTLTGVDISIYPVYKYQGDVNLIPVDEDGNGTTDYYQVGGYGANTGEQELVEIPASVNGVPVTEINADAFSSYDDLHSVLIPGTITAINSQSFSADDGNSWNGTQRDTITMYYAGDPAVWKAAMDAYNNRTDSYDEDGTAMLKKNWDNAMGESSCVFFLDENGKVDLSKGYWELANKSYSSIFPDFEWQYHDHEYGSNGSCSNEHNNTTDYYTGNCKCDSGTHVRADKEYWTTTATTTE